MNKERTDTLEHLVADLRKQHPRLVLIVGERHASEETRKHFTEMARQADVGFFEQKNYTDDPQGETMAGKHLDAHITLREMPRAPLKPGRYPADLNRSPTDKAFAEALRAPKTTVFVDPEIPTPSIETARDAVIRLYHDNTYHANPTYTAVRKIFHERQLDRLETSNNAMATAMANHLDAKFPGETPFFATLLVGDAHVSKLDKIGLANTEHDMKHVLTQRGYPTLVINFEPTRRIGPMDKAGKYHIAADFFSHGVDYTVQVTDPPALRQPPQSPHF